ncbi:MAG TPA: hypothetical protein VGQ36_18105 [Thermoanaerobaculia bacterium]|jgi:photosystem II stability/assembly factor-like uncharacterized protein|nr:hypothetical protein [Thermoanaerobaculia bacterium]
MEKERFPLRRKLGTLVGIMVVSLAASHQVLAQEWLRYLPQKLEREITFMDVQRAAEAYFKENPVDMKLEKILPIFRFEPQEERTRRIIEEYKLFKRFEWYVEPRVYPTGRWDFEKLDAIMASLPREDDKLVFRQAEANPLGVKFQADKIIWPPLLGWLPMGPSDAVGGTNMGRVNCIAFDPSNANTIYIGAPDGGVWKSTDGGVTWAPKFDTQPTLSVGDIAINNASPSILYAATSDSFGYGNPFWGGTYSVGVRKSTNGGNTWAATGLTWTVGQNRTIRRLVIHPTNGNILLAATSNGLYRTADAGVTWTQIWATSTFDVEFQQNNGNIVYATTTQVHKSTNAGVSFNPLTATCAGSRYNIEIASSNPNVLYTLCTNATVQKSTNAGATWATAAASGVTLYGYYDNVLAVSPINANIVYVAGFNIKRTTDGGATWASVAAAGHVDNHAIEFLPGSSSTIFSGNDGGLFKTTNSGTTWSSLNNGLAITQFYRMDIAETNAAIMTAGAQDNGNMKSAAGVWSNITNADGMDGFIDRTNANVIYAGIQNGGLYRTTTGGPPFTNVSTPSSGAWVTPWCQDPATATTIYAATDKVYKSLDQGTTWSPISGSLAGIWVFTVLKVAPSNPKIIYAGNGSKLYRTKDGGTTWTDITAGLPVATNYLMDVAIHDFDPSIAYVTFSGYVAGEKVYKTCNGGSAWSNISGMLPNIPANCIVHQKTNNGLYVGTDAGVYFLNDDLSDWVPYKFGLPNVIVDDLEIHYGVNKIRAATYGRGVWQAPLN